MRVFNKKHCVPSDAIYVGRPTIYGNPFIIGRDGDRDEVVEKYKEWLLAQPDLVNLVKKNLKGKSLVCWCAPLKCHADILLEIANS